MVGSINILLTGLVLLSTYDKVWKITDFGLASEGNSKRATTTHNARGTACYRAPELVQPEPSVSKQSDIWALGCILYELITGFMAFPSDCSTYEYMNARIQKPAITDLAVDGRLKACLTQLVSAMLEINWWERPSASAVVEIFRSISGKRTDIFVFDHPKLKTASTGTRVPSIFSYPGKEVGSMMNSDVDGMQVVIRARADSPVWPYVAWKPYWYMHSILY